MTFEPADERASIAHKRSKFLMAVSELVPDALTGLRTDVFPELIKTVEKLDLVDIDEYVNRHLSANAGVPPTRFVTANRRQVFHG